MSRWVAYALGILMGATSAWADGIEWNVHPDFKNEEAALEISGGVCGGEDGQRKWCFAVNDEKKYIQTFSIDEPTLKPGKRLRILEKRDGTGEKYAEPDAEGAAYHDGFIYVTGSHGAPRNGDAPQDSRFFVFRMPVDRQTGEPAFEVTREAVDPKIERTDELRPIIKTADGLSAHAEQALSNNGANIEGIAAMGDSLYFGFRAPTGPNGAVVLQVAIDRLFGTSETQATSHALDLGVGYGIRDMTRLGNRFLLLAGAASRDELVPVVWSWVPGQAPELIKALSVAEGRKAEGLMVLDASDQKKVRVLVLFDSRKNGEPTEFTLQLKR